MAEQTLEPEADSLRFLLLQEPIVLITAVQNAERVLPGQKIQPF
jgi:hypothetical protein